jgi:Flp pilus assembly protein TadG
VVKGITVFHAFLRDRRGNVAILSAIFITGLIGASGLTVEFGNGLLNHMQDQRIADLAAIGGANVYNSTSSTAAVTAAVANVATLNGISSSSISSSVVTSPSGDGNQAVQVTVSTSVPLVLSRVIWSNASLPISVTAYAEMKGGAPGCIEALNTAGTGVTLSGGTAVTASNCAVDSNNTVSVPCGTTITTKNVGYDSASAPSEPCNGIQPPSGSTLSIKKQVTTDPLAGTTEVTGATGRLSTVGAMTSPSPPSVSGGTAALSFGYSASPTQATITAAGCSSTFSSPTWTVTCPNGGTYTFGAVSLSGGITVNFNTSGTSSTTLNFNGQVNDSGTALHFGPGTYNITGGVVSGGGSTTTFSNGTFNIGQSATSCNSYIHYSICNSGTLMTFGSSTTASKFVFTGGVYNKGGETLVLGGTSVTSTSTGNSFNIGTASNGNSFDMGGGSITMFADASGAGNLFQMAGNVNVSSGGGSCLWLGAANEHDINGFISAAGGTTLGAGVYTLTKYMWLGANGGGDVTCGGSTVGIYGSGVTLVLGGSGVPSSGTCANNSFCTAAGYNDITLTAPSSGSTQGLVVIGPTSSSNTNGASFIEGATNTSMSGAFYMPYGPINLSGGASVGNGSGQCLEVIGSQVTLAGGSELASSCNIPGSGGSGGATVALVQ